MATFDDQARAMGRIMGESLDSKLTLAEYMDSRGQGNPEATALLRRAVELRDADAAAPCPKCLGDKQIADSDDGEPWSAWANLPPGSDLAVRTGMVKPITCPECKGTGTKP
jgi:hypothetical protein